MQILAAIEAALTTDQPLSGKHILVTSGPTLEPIDPVRFISNRSSGKQGHAIATAAARMGARVSLISGPVAIPDPAGVTVKHVESAREMLAAAQSALPADIAIFAAAVADWRTPDVAGEKIKKAKGAPAPHLNLIENPDILRTLATPGSRRPDLVVGFAAETEHVIENAKKKLAAKGCDWIVANDVSPATGTFGGTKNTVHLVSAAGVENWPELTKDSVAERLMQRIVETLEKARTPK